LIASVIPLAPNFAKLTVKEVFSISMAANSGLHKTKNKLNAVIPVVLGFILFSFPDE